MPVSNKMYTWKYDYWREMVKQRDELSDAVEELARRLDIYENYVIPASPRSFTRLTGSIGPVNPDDPDVTVYEWNPAWFDVRGLARDLQRVKQIESNDAELAKIKAKLTPKRGASD